jgi:RNA polymerase sigma factor for flagellar operon FliA
MQRKVDEQTLSEMEGLVRSIALKVRSRLGLRIDLDELFQIGMVGLLESAERYDPESGVALTTFAYTRIYGAILDGVGQMTGLKRAQVRRHKRMIASVETVGSLDFAEPDASPESYVASAIDGVLFSGMMKEVVEDETPAEVEGESPYTSSPERSLARHQLRELVLAVVDGLPSDEAQLLRAHYVEGRSLTDVGEELGVSRSWASRVHTRALKKARRVLEEQHGIALSDLSDATFR